MNKIQRRFRKYRRNLLHNKLLSRRRRIFWMATSESGKKCWIFGRYLTAGIIRRTIPGEFHGSIRKLQKPLSAWDIIGEYEMWKIYTVSRTEIFRLWLVSRPFVNLLLWNPIFKINCSNWPVKQSKKILPTLRGREASSLDPYAIATIFGFGLMRGYQRKFNATTNAHESVTVNPQAVWKFGRIQIGAI